MQLDSRDKRLHAVVNHIVYGPTTHYSEDFGMTWTQAKQVLAITRASKSGLPLGTVQEAERFASTGGCYRTDDGGESWEPLTKSLPARDSYFIHEILELLADFLPPTIRRKRLLWKSK